MALWSVLDQEDRTIKEVSIIGVDLAKLVFRLHGATAEGEGVFRKKPSGKQFVAFMRVHPLCQVAMASLRDGPLSCPDGRRIRS